MTARTVTASKAALAKARERREKLDEDVRAKEQRQDVATALATVALERLAEIEATRDGVLAEVGDAVRALMDEDVAAERAAGLLGIDVAEVRRLAKVVQPEAPAAPISAKSAGKAASGSSNTTSTGAAGERNATVASLPGQGGSEDAARRAG